MCSYILAVRRADRPEQPGILVALVSRLAWPRAAPAGPLAADAGFVLEPDLDRLALGWMADMGNQDAEEVFFECFHDGRILPRMTRPDADMRKTNAFQQSGNIPLVVDDAEALLDRALHIAPVTPYGTGSVSLIAQFSPAERVNFVTAAGYEQDSKENVLNMTQYIDRL